MPIPPKPKTYVCQSCGWKKTVAPKSDVLLPTDVVKQCPECGGTQFKTHVPGLIEKLLAS